MRKLLIIMVCFSASCFAQLKIGYFRNIDFYKPYTSEAQEYIMLYDNVKSQTNTFQVTKKMLEKASISWDLGLTFKNTKHIVEHKIKGYYTENCYQQGCDYEFISTDLDLISKSNSLGLVNTIYHTFSSNSNFHSSIGINNEIYFYENYISTYYYSNTHDRFDGDKNSFFNSLNNNDLPRNFFFSSSNIALFYCLRYQQSDKFSLATKISLGTNLYSDWDQFKKYAWLGVGLELGFGKKKNPKLVDGQ